MKLYALCLLVLMTTLSIDARADPNLAQPRVIRISGAISEQTLTKVRLDLVGFRNQDPLPAGLIVLLDSPGGDGDAAMAIGRLLRQRQAHVFVSRRCDSACVFLLMGGVVRAANPGTLGVHAGRLTVMQPDGQVLREVDASKSLPDSFQLAGYNRDIRLYLQEMGIGHGILDVMLAHRHVYKLTSEDMSRYRVTGFDNAYLNQRIHCLDSLGYNRQVNRIQFFNRTMSVPKACMASELADREFIGCYGQTVLATR